MLEKEKNPVLYFKEPGEPATYKSGIRHVELDSQDFCLIIMTPFQEEMLLKFGSDKICVDGFHGLNAYNFLS